MSTVTSQFLDKPIFRIVSEVAAAGGVRAFVIGGYVRDCFLGRPCNDIDIVVEGSGIDFALEVGRRTGRHVSYFKNFGTAMLHYGPDEIEFVGARKESYRRESRKPIVENGTLEDDQKRRDFTINALYYNPITEELIDYHNGMRDILDGVVRMIGYPEERYREDPVRMLRAVRIASKLQFKIDEATLEPISRLAPLLGNVPEARLFDEAVKLLTCGRAIDCMDKLRSLGLYRNVIPLLEVALKEQKGERFLMLAMKRTDERIAIGKKVSPSFLFATLLWPLTYRHFEERISRGEGQIQAMIEAGRYVLDRQCEKLAIQKRFVEDILTIWILQIKLLRRGTKSAMGLLNIPKFRAGYDFMLLRSQLEFVDPAIVEWWTKFQEVDEETRLEMIREQANANAQARKPRKGEPKKPSKAQIKKQLLLEADSWQLVRDLSGTAGSDGLIDLIDDETAETVQKAPAPRARRRRRTPIRRKKIQIED